MPSFCRALFLPSLTAAVASASFLTMRLAFHSNITMKSSVDGGLLQYDSYYPLAFARQLLRQGEWIWFSNPYGTLDSIPGLANGTATMLALSAPWWTRDLFSFDLIVGSVASAVGGAAFAAAAQARGSCRATIAIALLLVVIGGGFAHVVGALAPDLGPDFRMEAVGTHYWGLTWQSNQLATWEIVYHAIFWVGTFALATDRGRLVVAVAAVLMMLHPFNFIIFVGLAGLTTLLQLRLAAYRATATRQSVALAWMTFASIAFYSFVLPQTSHDAHFFKAVYEQVDFKLPANHILLALAPQLLLAVMLLRRTSLQDRDPFPLACMATSVGLIMLSLSHYVSDVVPQPAHWLRVYPVALAVLGAVALRRVGLPRSQLAAVGIIGVVAAVDSLLGHRAALADLENARALPAALSGAQAELLDRLRSLPRRLVFVLRPCSGEPVRPDLEYAISALTEHEVMYGHIYFSPDWIERSRSLQACRMDAAAWLTILNAYVVVPSGAPVDGPGTLVAETSSYKIYAR